MTRTRIPALVALVVAVAMTGAASGQPGDLFELRAGGNLDWVPTSGAINVSSGSKVTASGVLTSPFGNAAFEEAAGPGVARTSLVGSFTNPPLETRRLDPSTFARATTRLTVTGPDGVVSVRLKAHIDATVLHACPPSFLCASTVTVFVGDHNAVVSQPGGADPNFLGLDVDAVPGGYRVHGDYVSPLRPVFANSAFDAILSIQLSVHNFGRGTAESSSFDARGEVSFPATGTVLEVPSGYTVTGENVEDNHWADPFAPPPAPDIELRFADGTPIGGGDVLDLGTIASGATSAPTSFTIANTGTAALHVQPLTAPAGFAVDGQPDGTLAPGSPTAPSLTCSSTNNGTAPVVLDDVVTVVSDDPDEGSLDLDVRCTVLPESPPEPDIELRDESDTPLPPPHLLDLGDVASGSPATATYRIANVGTAALTIANITTDVPPGLGGTTPPGAGSVQPGASTTAGVSCGGINPGDATINLQFRVRVFSNDLDESPADLLVRCRVRPASEPEIALYYDGEPMPPNVVIDVGDVPSGGSVTRSYQIANVGDGQLTIGSIEATKPAFGAGSASGPDDSTVDPGDSARAQFSCGGTNTGDSPREVEFEVRVESDDPDESPASFAVRCQILPAEPYMELRYEDGTPMSGTPTFDLGDVANGESVQGHFQIANVGNARLFGQVEVLVDEGVGYAPTYDVDVEPGTSEDFSFSCRAAPWDPNFSGTIQARVLFWTREASDLPYGGTGFRFRCRVLPADTSPPTLSLPAATTVDATGPAGATVTYSVSASDLVDPTPTLNCSPTSGSVFPIGTTTVNCTATDDAGNSAPGSFTVTVRAAAAQITALIAKTEAFVDSPAIRVVLRAMLRAASQAFAAGRKPAACAALAAYTLGVRAVPRGSLSGAEKAELIAVATRIRTVIGC